MSLAIDFSQIVNVINQLLPLIVSIMVVTLVINLISGFLGGS
jgi:phage-related protein